VQRWSRATRKTERLIDFDGSSAAPRGDRTYSCHSLLPASFQPGFTIIRAPVWPPRLLRGTKDPRHRFARRQWLLATIPFILPSLFRFITSPLTRVCSLSLSLSLSRYIYLFRGERAQRGFRRFGARSKDRFGDAIPSAKPAPSARRPLWSLLSR